MLIGPKTRNDQTARVIRPELTSARRRAVVTAYGASA